MKTLRQHIQESILSSTNSGKSALEYEEFPIRLVKYIFDELKDRIYLDDAQQMKGHKMYARTTYFVRLKQKDVDLSELFNDILRNSLKNFSQATLDKALSPQTKAALKRQQISMANLATDSASEDSYGGEAAYPFEITAFNAFTIGEGNKQFTIEIEFPEKYYNANKREIEKLMKSIK